MLIPTDKIDAAKAKYDGQAIQEIVQHFGLEGSYNEKDKVALVLGIEIKLHRSYGMKRLTVFTVSVVVVTMVL